MTFIKIYDKIPQIMKMYEFMMSGNPAVPDWFCMT